MTQAFTTSTHSTQAMVQFGIAEIAYLLSLGEGANAAKSREALKISDTYFSTAMRGAGASALVARGFASVKDDSIELAGPSHMLSYAFATAQQWTELALLGTEEVDAALYLQAPGMSVFLQPAALGVWAALIKLPDAADEAMLKLLIDTKLTSEPNSAIFFDAAALTGQNRRLFVRREAAGWSTAWVTDPDAAPDVTVTDTAGLLDTLATLVPAVGIEA